LTAAIKTLIAGIILLVGAASFASAGFIGVHYFSATTTQTQTTFATVQTTVVDIACSGLSPPLPLVINPTF
jgi:hypothetical protein